MKDAVYTPKEDYYFRLAQEKGYVLISRDKASYTQIGKSYKANDPEELVRIAFYTELIEHYHYPKERIDLEVIVPRRKPEDKADIVTYEDDEKKKPYIVAECKKDGISKAELNQAIEQVFGNANSLRAKYAIVVAGTVRIAFDVAGFPPEEREKNVIADIPVRYGKVVKYAYKKGGPENKDDPSKELKEVNRDELLTKFQQCHDTLWEGGKRNPAEAFDEMSKLMYCKIQDERFLTKKGEYYRFQVGTYETINEVAERIKKIYKDAQEIDPEVFVEPIKTDNPIIHTIAEILQGISLARTELDVKGEGYEHFLGGVFRGAMGQYFTPRPIVTFMVDFLEPNINDFVIDPACGSGGFLIHTLEKMRKELYAKLDEKDAAYRWQDFALKQVYGIEINNQLARVSMMNMIIHEDGHTNIENTDALDNPDKWKKQKIKEWFGKKFTLLLTNPPFGAPVKEKEKSYLTDYQLGAKIKKRNQQKAEILFIERCLDFLKPDGRMGIVLPDGILTNSSLQYVRDFITERAQILGVVSLPQTAFRKPSSKGSGDTGSGVKASLLFLRKKKEGEKLPDDYSIFMSIAEHIGYDATGRPDKNEFPEILKVYGEFKKTNRITLPAEDSLCFAVSFGRVNSGRFDPHYYLPVFEHTLNNLKRSKYPLVELGTLIKEIRYGASVKNIYTNEGIPLLRILNLKPNVIDLSDVVKLPFDVKEKIGKCYVSQGDLLISRSGTIGIVAVVPKEANGYAFGSFMIKFTLVDEVNPFYISIILNSDPLQQQIQQKKIGAIQRNITIPTVRSLKIPLPPREIQDEITKEFFNRMDKARELHQKAEIIIQEADKKLEQEIF